MGHRHLEIISAVSGTERGDNTTLDATLLDLAYGLAPGFEIDATFSLTHDDHDRDDDGHFEYGGAPLTLGFKWEVWRSGGFLASVAPSVSFNLDDGNNVSGGFPLIVQYDPGRWRVGAEARFVPTAGDRDGWRSGVYAGLSVGPAQASELLVEVHSSAFKDRGDPEVGWNLGVDLAVSCRVHLLASGGTGLYGGAGSIREWSSYLGVQLLLGPFEEGQESRVLAPASPASLAGRPARVDGSSTIHPAAL